DGVRGLGAAVKNLSHRASRNVASAWLIPRHSGTAHLANTPFRTLLGRCRGSCEHFGGLNGGNKRSQLRVAKLSMGKSLGNAALTGTSCLWGPLNLFYVCGMQGRSLNPLLYA